MHGAFIDHHAYGDGPLHRLDARVKLCIVLLYVAVVATTPVTSARAYLFWVPLLAFALPLSGVPLGHLLNKALRLWPFVILMTLFIPFLKTGQVFWSLRPALPVDVTREGLALFGHVLVKAFLAILAMTLLNATTPFAETLKALEWLRTPKLIVALLACVYRYLFVLFEEKERLLRARRCRLIRPPLKLKYKSLAQIISTLFLRTFERGERVYQAMGARGYTGEVRTLHAHPLGHLEAAGPGAHGVGKGALLMAEEFGFQQFPGNGPAVDGHERLVGPAAVGVQGAHQQFLARARLARDKDGAVRGGDLAQDPEHVVQDRAGADDFAGVQLHVPSNGASSRRGRPSPLHGCKDMSYGLSVNCLTQCQEKV